MSIHTTARVMAERTTMATDRAPDDRLLLQLTRQAARGEGDDDRVIARQHDVDEHDRGEGGEELAEKQAMELSGSGRRPVARRALQWEDGNRAHTFAVAGEVSSSQRGGYRHLPRGRSRTIAGLARDDDRRAEDYQPSMTHKVAVAATPGQTAAQKFVQGPSARPRTGGCGPPARTAAGRSRRVGLGRLLAQFVFCPDRRTDPPPLPAALRGVSMAHHDIRSASAPARPAHGRHRHSSSTPIDSRRYDTGATC